LKNLKFMLIVASALASVVSPIPANADIKPNLKDAYIEREFEWAAYVHARKSTSFLNYPQSRLTPMTKVSVTFRDGIKSPTNMYEEFWYHRGKPVGMRRINDVTAKPDKLGAIVLGGQDDSADSTQALVNALARLVIDFQLRHLVTSVVIVPKDHFGEIVSALSDYKFRATDTPPSSGEQFSLTLRSAPYGYEQVLFLQH
jgi:hypothetical protein